MAPLSPARRPSWDGAPTRGLSLKPKPHSFISPLRGASIIHLEGGQWIISVSGRLIVSKGWLRFRPQVISLTPSPRWPPPPPPCKQNHAPGSSGVAAALPPNTNVGRSFYLTAAHGCEIVQHFVHSWHIGAKFYLICHLNLCPGYLGVKYACNFPAWSLCASTFFFFFLMASHTRTKLCKGLFY